jgi:hypothetical protein
MRGIQVHYTRGNGIPLDGMIDGGKNDGVFRDVNNHLAASEIADNFVLAVLRAA